MMPPRLRGQLEALGEHGSATVQVWGPSPAWVEHIPETLSFIRIHQRFRDCPACKRTILGCGGVGPPQCILPAVCDQSLPPLERKEKKIYASSKKAPHFLNTRIYKVLQRRKGLQSNVTAKYHSAGLSGFSSAALVWRI